MLDLFRQGTLRKLYNRTLNTSFTHSLNLCMGCVISHTPICILRDPYIITYA